MFTRRCQTAAVTCLQRAIRRHLQISQIFRFGSGGQAGVIQRGPPQTAFGDVHLHTMPPPPAAAALSSKWLPLVRHLGGSSVDTACTVNILVMYINPQRDCDKYGNTYPEI